eukprot:g69468.t1
MPHMKSSENNKDWHDNLDFRNLGRDTDAMSQQIWKGYGQYNPHGTLLCLTKEKAQEEKKKKKKNQQSLKNMSSAGLIANITSERDLEGRFGEAQPIPRKPILQHAKDSLRTALADSLPARVWLRQYSRAKATQDFLTGLTVGIVMVPQGLAYASLAGLPPEYGLYCSMLPSVLYALLGTSRELSVGPFALTSLLIADALAATLAQHNNPSKDLMIGYAMGLSLIVGLTLMLFWLFQFGFLVSFLSKAVLSGFTTGSAVLIATSQVSKVFGIKVPKGDFIETWAGIFKAWGRGQTNWIAFGISLFTILWLLGGKKFDQKKRKGKVPLPWEVLIVVGGILLSWGVDLKGEYGVGIIGKIPHGLPGFAAPMLSPVLISHGITIAVISFIICMSISKTFADKHDYQVSANQELLALGVLNLVGSFFLCYPACGGLSRSAVVDAIGVQTQAHNLVSAAVVALVLLFLTKALFYLPEAVLAGIILAALKSLFQQMDEPIRLWKISKGESMVWLATFFCTFFLNTQTGIIVGVISSMLVLVHTQAYPSCYELGQLPGTSIYRNLSRFPDINRVPGVLIMRFGTALNFANQDRFQSRLKALLKAHKVGAGLEDPPIHAVVVDAAAIESADASSLDMISSLTAALEAQNIKLLWAAARFEFRAQLAGLGHKGSCYLGVAEAVAACTSEQPLGVNDVKSTDTQRSPGDGHHQGSVLAAAETDDAAELDLASQQDRLVVMHESGHHA